MKNLTSYNESLSIPRKQDLDALGEAKQNKITVNGIVQGDGNGNLSATELTEVETIELDAAAVGLGNVDNVKQYSASNPPPYPVTSVNGAIGAVTVDNISLGLSNISTGQVPVVKSIDASGKPTAWETSSAPGVLPVTFTSGDTGEFSCDKTNAEIYEAFSAGKIVTADAPPVMGKTRMRCVYATNTYALFVAVVVGSIATVTTAFDVQTSPIGDQLVKAYDDNTLIAFPASPDNANKLISFDAMGAPAIASFTGLLYADENGAVTSVADVTDADNGKVLQVEDGTWTAKLPTLTDADKTEIVNEVIADGVEATLGPVSLPAPASAAVGQIVKVKAVDAEGKITETEAADLPTGGSTARKIFPVNFKAVDTIRSAHDCTFIGDEIVSFSKPSDGGYARYINPQTWVSPLQRKINFTEAATNKALEMKSTDYKFGKLLVGNGRTIKSDESSYTDQGARLYVFYDAASWRDDPAAEITFDNCGTYDVIDISGLGYKVYGFWGGAADTVFVSCNLFNDIYLIQLGAGTNNLGTGAYSAAEDSRYNGSYKVIGHWTNTNNYGEFAAHGGQYYNGSLYLATNDTSKCTVYRCVLKDDGTMDFDALNFEAYIPSVPNTLMYRYIDGMCIKDGILYAQPLTVGTVNITNSTIMLVAELTAFGDKLPDNGSAGQVLTKQTDGSVAWNTPSGGSGGGMEIIASGELSEDATLLEISTDNDGNAFELTEAVLFVGGAVSEANTTNGSMTLRTNINSAAKGGGGTIIAGFFRNAAPKKYQIHLVCAGVITGASFYNGSSTGYVNDNFDTITKIFLFGTDANGKTFGAGTTYILKGVRK